MKNHSQLILTTQRAALLDVPVQNVPVILDSLHPTSMGTISHAANRDSSSGRLTPTVEKETPPWNC